MPSPFKLCIDPGHGMGNRTDGVFDPGCGEAGLNEASIVLVWAEELRRAVEARGTSVFMTRRDQVTPCPVSRRASLAKTAGCTHFISIHVNDADNALAHGTETLYRDDKEFAEDLQTELLKGLALRDRGVKQRLNLAVLKFPGKAALLELGFIKNPQDMEAVTNSALRAHTCRMLASLF